LCESESDDEEENENDIIVDEIKRYRKFKHRSLHDLSCPLDFYRSNQNIFPGLSKLAELVFCTTASSVPSECVFSACGQLINKRRTRLRPELAEDLLFLNRNDLL